MPRRRRGNGALNLAFLDIMSCGFGAVVLLFLIIKHHAEASVQPAPAAPVGEVALLRHDIRQGEQRLGELQASLRSAEQARAALEAQVAAARAALEAARQRLAALGQGDDPAEIEALKARLKSLEQERQKLASELARADAAARSFVGEGQREYLTGLKLGGRRILILLDASASMLDDTIVNVLRRRNMAPEAQRRAAKWRQAVSTVDWLTARLPRDSRYQIVAFNVKAEPVLPDTRGQWLEVGDTARLDAAVARTRELLPEGGTSLHRAFEAARALSPAPDNIFLITDGLPTQGASGKATGTVSGRRRIELFEAAVKRLPAGNPPVNVILLPMEGDPFAAAAFWQLAQATRGALITPSEDWP